MDDSTTPPPYHSSQGLSPWPEPFGEEPAYPIVFWIVWILSGVPLLWWTDPTGIFMHFFAQLTLATTWLSMAPRVSARFFAPAALCYTPLLILGLVFGFLAFLICLAMFGLPWLILRAFRLLALDFSQVGPEGQSITPNLAERSQFSLRTIGAVCVIAALGCALWMGAGHSRTLHDMRYFVAIFVPCELLFLLGMLGRGAWYSRAVLLLIAPLLLLAWTWLMRHGDLEEYWIVMLLPASQLIVLAVLRRAGYRIGMPRSAEVAFDTSSEKQPQSPWD